MSSATRGTGYRGGGLFGPQYIFPSKSIQECEHHFYIETQIEIFSDAFVSDFQTQFFQS